MSTATQPRTKTVVTPFGIEADSHCNADLLLQAVPGHLRLRSRLSATRTRKNPRTGDERIPVDPARHLALLPSVPGMQIHVNPANCTYIVLDPLHTDEEMCEKIQAALAADERPIQFTSKIRGVPPQNGTVDVHRMKTLCRELLAIVETGDAKMVKGAKPDRKNIDDLPGKYLLNPGSLIPNTQPRYERDWDEWVAQLTRAGG